MDPDAALFELCTLAHKVVTDRDAGLDLDEDEAGALAAEFLDLDRWLAAGGFLPKAWRPKGTPNG